VSTESREELSEGYY